MSQKLDEKVNVDIEEDRASSITSKKHRGAIVLVPQPSDDPRDPLNWPAWKKGRMLAALTLAAFCCSGSPSANQLAFVVQAKTFGKTSNELTYTVSAGLAGFIVGPFLYPPLFSLFGRAMCIFWGMLALLVCQVWAATQTRRDEFNSLVVSRLFAGLVGVIPITAGCGFILEAFYLHQRGRLFALFELVFLLGAAAIPTIGGFILQAKHWPWVFWWTCPLIGFSALLTFLWVEETNFDRETLTCVRPPSGWLAGRFTTIFLGWRVVKPTPRKKVIQETLNTFKIQVSPAALIPGLYNMVAFGFAIIVQLTMSIFLQTPVKKGGYGFTPLQNACFLFTSWIALGTAEIVGLLMSDRLPLWAASRKGGTWKPEYRLLNVIPTGFLLPIALGIYGSALQYHLHYMVLALGQFLVQFSAQISIPLCTNYVIECFVDHPVEASVGMNSWRKLLGLALPFALTSWENATGVGWLFGIAGFICLFVFLCVLGVAWKGEKLRDPKINWHLVKSEDGERVKL